MDPDAGTVPGLPVATDPTPPGVAEQLALSRVRARVLGVSSRVHHIGRYVLLDRLGEGAMGVVLSAYDPVLRREVAIKVIKGGDALQREGLADRLLREAKALARLRHPNVVQVFEILDHDEGQAIVMEFVRGRTLRQWLTAEPRSWPQVCTIFAACALGLDAAHRADVVHRDFKPDNVLVDDDDVPKIVDFGLAMHGAAEVTASEHPDSRDETATQTGFVLGTPAYMAPEQHAGARADARADQYAFCVALFEALNGTRPFRAETVEALALAKSEQEPASSRRGTPRWLTAVVRRGLAADPEDRWPDLATLRRALLRRPGRRWARGLALAAGVAVTVAAVHELGAQGAERCRHAGDHLAGIWDDARRDEIAAAMRGTLLPYAEPVWRRTEGALDRYTETWVDEHTAACEATRVHATQSEAAMDLRIGCLHRARTELLAVTEQLARADGKVVEHAHELVEGLTPASRCSDLEALAMDVEPPRPRDAAAVDEIREHGARARAAMLTGHYDEARRALAPAQAQLDAVDYDPVRAEIALLEGDIETYLGRFREAEAAFHEGLRLATGMRSARHVNEAATRLVCSLGLHQQRFAAGGAYARLAIRDARGQSPARVAHMEMCIGAMFDLQGRYDDAVAQHRRALALMEPVLEPSDPDLAMPHNNLCNSLLGQGRYAEAEAECREALAIWEPALGSDHPRVALVRTNLGNALSPQGRAEDAEVEHRRALASRIAALGPDHPDVGTSHNNLGSSLFGRGEHEEAALHFQRALEIWRESLGPDQPEIGMCHNNLGEVYAAAGDPARAEREHRRALEVWHRALGEQHPYVAYSHHNLGDVLGAQGHLDEADEHLRRAVQLRETLLGVDHPMTQATRIDLAALWVRRGRHDEALSLATSVWRSERLDDIGMQALAEAALTVAEAKWAAQPAARAEARRWAAWAWWFYVEAEATDHPDAQRVRAWLDAHGAS